MKESMKMKGINKFVIKQKEAYEGQLMTGPNTEVFMNGKRLNNVKSFKFEIDAVGVGKVTLEMYGQVKIEGLCETLPKINEERTVSCKARCHSTPEEIEDFIGTLAHGYESFFIFPDFWEKIQKNASKYGYEVKVIENKAGE